MNYAEKAEFAVALSEKVLKKMWDYELDPPVYQAALALSWAQSCLLEGYAPEEFEKMAIDIVEYFEECHKILNSIEEK